MNKRLILAFVMLCLIALPLAAAMNLNNNVPPPTTLPGNNNNNFNLQQGGGGGGGNNNQGQNVNVQVQCTASLVQPGTWMPDNIQTPSWHGGCCGSGADCVEVYDYMGYGEIDWISWPNGNCGNSCQEHEECVSFCDGVQSNPNIQEVCLGTITWNCLCKYDDCDIHTWSCRDMDGGQATETAAATTGLQPLTNNVRGYHDACVIKPGDASTVDEGNYVREYFCLETQEAHYNDLWCQFGCEDGACRANAVGGPEICNGIDDDGDLEVDEGCDDDNDNYCDSSMGRASEYICDIPNANGDPQDCCYLGGNDCADEDPFINPFQVDECDGLDNDCSGAVDDANACMLNEQCNGAAGCGCTDDHIDSDGNPINGCEDYCVGAVNGVAPLEICDGVDNDCDGLTDEGCDVDRDGWCADGMWISEVDAAVLNADTYPQGDTYMCTGPYCCQETVDSYNLNGIPDDPAHYDCNDQNFFESPSHEETGPTFCTDGFDNDCDGLVDADEPSCNFMLICEKDAVVEVDDPHGNYYECDGGQEDTWCSVSYGEVFQSCNTDKMDMADVGTNNYHVYLCGVDGCEKYYSDTFEVKMDPAEDSDYDGLHNQLEIDMGSDPFNADTDGDGVTDGDEEINGNGIHEPIIDETDVLLDDTDGDGLLDGEELYIYNTDPNDPDTDGDNWDDGKEVAADTDPLNPADFPQDADQDGIPDQVEQAYPNPDVDNDGLENWLDDNSDDDGLLDGEEDLNGDGEVQDGESDPYDKDSDDDGLEDHHEVNGQYGPNGDTPTEPLVKDTDGDGLDDGEEDISNLGVWDVDETDPTIYDTDGDGASDGAEANSESGDPLDPDIQPDDADNDGIPDDLEGPGDYDLDGIPNFEDPDSDNDFINDSFEDKNGDGEVLLFFGPENEPYETDAYNVDTDGDTIHDGDEDDNVDGELDIAESDPRRADSDGDLLDDPIEILYGTNFRLVDSDYDLIWDGVEDANLDGMHVLDLVTFEGETNAMLTDTDGDEIVDGVEDANQDGIVDGGEYPETDPRNPDSDGDGIEDGAEITLGANPLDPNNPPLDSDGDCIPDQLEQAIDTDGDGILNHLDVDSDNDWLFDGDEVGCIGVFNEQVDVSNHLDFDTDDDCYSDYYEVQSETNPKDPESIPQDTDEDCVPDEFEGNNVDLFMCENVLVDEEEEGLDCGDNCAYICNPQQPLLWPGPCAGGVCYHGCHDDYDCDGFKDATENVCVGGSSEDPLVFCTDDTDPTLDYEESEFYGLQNSDTDRDGLSNYDELFEYQTNPTDADSDDDGFFDGTEVNENTNPNNPDDFPQDAQPNNPTLQCENDVADEGEEGVDCGGSCLYVCENGASNGQCEDDMDCDGWKDSTEEDCESDPEDPTDGCDSGNPLDDYTDEELEALDNMDTDGDGLSNLFELEIGTNPNNPDTDGDGWDDGAEVNHPTDPLDDTDFPESQNDCTGDSCDDNNDNDDYNCDTTYDADCDGLYDEYDMDSDGDGINDGDEVALGTNPDEWDSDGDGFSDGAEVAAGSNPMDANDVPVDSDGDGIPDVVEGDADPDGDGLPNSEDTDSDGDGLSDGEEDKNGDGKVQFDETNAYVADTDGDGFSDKEERDADSDPLDPDSTPEKASPHKATLAERIQQSNANAPPAQSTVDRSKYRPERSTSDDSSDDVWDEEWADAEESSSFGWLIMALVALGILGTGGYFGYMYWYKPAHTPKQAPQAPGMPRRKGPGTANALSSKLTQMQQKKKLASQRKKSLATTLKSRIKQKNAVVANAKKPLKPRKVDFKPNAKDKSELDALKNIAGDSQPDEIDALDKLADKQESKKKTPRKRARKK